MYVSVGFRFVSILLTVLVSSLFAHSSELEERILGYLLLWVKCVYANIFKH